MTSENQSQPAKLDKAVLDRFLADNPELEELSAKMATFNLFRALKIEKKEIRHSNVLAWLLNPNESHGLGDTALRRLFSNILLGRTLEGVSSAEVELMQFNNIEIRTINVMREWKHIDVLIIDHRNKLILLIENKIDARESPGQLVRYKKEVQKHFSNYRIIPVFLTLAGDETCDEEASDYICYSYVKVLNVLEKLLKQKAPQLAEPVLLFLNQYLDTLRRLTMQDESTIKLCKTIYQRHREAIDMIMEYGATNAGKEIVEELLNSDGEFEILSSNAKWIWFIPNSWANYIPENGAVWTHLKRNVSVVCFINFMPTSQKIRIVCEISKMDDSALRLNAVNALKEAKFKLLAHKAFNENTKTSGFFTEKLHIDDMSDSEELKRVVQKLFFFLKPKISIAEQVFKEVFVK